MLFYRTGVFALIAAGLVALATAGATAATDEPGVARVSLLHGNVDVKRSDSGDTIAASINAPVNPGDYLTTHEDARAEIQFAYATALRVAAATDVRFVALDSEHARVQLAAGTVELRLTRGARAHAEVETSVATIRPTETGRYRIAVSADGATTVTVRSGRADVVTDSGTRELEAGSALALGGNANDNAGITVAAGPDDFDRWNDDRDRALAEANGSGYRYVDDDIVGANDLATFGHWLDDSRYGRVWSPYERSGWSPYHDGRFVWEPYYGWTWIANEPWGWAPYHYGNWFYGASSGWCWYPGINAFAQPFVYRPAIVAFLSFGGFNVGFNGFNSIGWVPLAPYETFSPWYGYSNRTVVNNITYVTNVYGSTPSGNSVTIYRNLRAPGGAAAVDRHAFSAGNFARLAIPSHESLAHAAPVRGIVPIVPTTANLRFTQRPVTVTETAPHGDRFANFPRPTIATRPFVATVAAIREATAQMRMMPRPDMSAVRPAIVRRANTPIVMGAEIPVVRPAIATRRIVPVEPIVIDLGAGRPAAVRAHVAMPMTPSRERSMDAVRPASPWDRFSARISVSEGGRSFPATNSGAHESLGTRALRSTESVMPAVRESRSREIENVMPHTGTHVEGVRPEPTLVREPEAAARDARVERLPPHITANRIRE